VGPSVEVSCYHHQALETLGDGLAVTARSEEGVIEGVELPSAPGWFLGVQWHPEDNWRTVASQRAVFEALVSATAAPAAH
jgi:putative glutamine amidotransferase